MWIKRSFAGCIRLASLFGLLCLMGCQPSLNWRVVQLEGTQLSFELPCKPDRTLKTVQMAGQTLELAVAGCEADHAVWAVMSTKLPSTVNRSEVLNGWRQDTLKNMKAHEVLDVNWTPPKMAALPGTLRIKAKGIGPEQQAVFSHAVWLTHLEADFVRLVHLVVYQNKNQAFQDEQQTAPFFESVKLP
jgi:hypothetical protein